MPREQQVHFGYPDDHCTGHQQMVLTQRYQHSQNAVINFQLHCPYIKDVFIMQRNPTCIKGAYVER